MKPLRVLHVEDNPADSRLIDVELRRGGFEVVSHRVDTAAAMAAALERETWSLIVSDYRMPSFDAPAALEVLKRSGRDIPFVIVSGSIGEETAVETLKNGAADFIIKDNLARLVPAVERELADAQARKERREAFAALEEAVKVRDEFISLASHELTTPLAAVRLQLQGLLRGLGDGDEPPADLRTRLESAARNADRLSRLIEQLLEITRLTSGRLDLALTPCDFAAIVRASVETHSKQALRAGTGIVVSAPPSLPGRWDRERLRVMVGNLLDNAIRYGGQEPVAVAVEDAGKSVRLSVRDHGIGIASEDQERIFDRFQRAVSGEHYAGLGLGLWLSRRIVESHGGTISVESAPGSGSNFVVTLPKAPPDEIR
jgi:signal transduction histidine kinase